MNQMAAIYEDEGAVELFVRGIRRFEDNLRTLFEASRSRRPLLPAAATIAVPVSSSFASDPAVPTTRTPWGQIGHASPANSDAEALDRFSLEGLHTLRFIPDGELSDYRLFDEIHPSGRWGHIAAAVKFQGSW